MNNQKVQNVVGKRVHDYIFVKQLGKGAYGEVYSAKNTTNGMIVAVKCIPQSKLSEHNGIVGQLLKGEVEVLQMLNSPHVVKLIQYMESANQCYIVLEYCNQGDFEQHWQKHNKRIPESDAIDFMKQILTGMQALHEKNVIHRDLKLANILIHNNTLKIADLGFCKQLRDKDDKELLSLGSLGNMAPEIVEQKPYGMAADMFSIGTIFYQMIFGAFPFSCANQRAFLSDIQTRQPDFRRGDIKISLQLEQLITKMLIKDPNYRLKWSELYAHPLMAAKKDLRNVALSINQMAAEGMDAIAYKQFYGNMELYNNNIPNQVQIQQQENPRNINRIDIKEIETQFYEQNDQNVEELLRFQDEQIMKEQEITKVIEKYMQSRNEIVYLSRTLDKINKVDHKQMYHGLFPSLIISKKASILCEKLLNRLLHGENVFQTKYIKEVYENPYFLKFQNIVVEENAQFQDVFKFQIVTSKQNIHEVEKYIQKLWISEISEYPTPQFNVIFREALNDYLFVLQETRQQHQKDAEKQLIINTQIHLIDCILYDKILAKSNIDVGREFDNLANLSYQQRCTIFDEKFNQMVQLNF